MELGATATRTGYADVFSARPGVGASTRDGTLDVGLYFRPLLYRAFVNAAWRVDHRGGFDAFMLKANGAELSPKALLLKKAIEKKIAGAAPEAKAS